MNYVAFDPRAGAPRPGDLVWSALPDAPVQEHRSRFARLRSRAQGARARTAPRLEGCPTTNSSASPAASR